MIKFTKGPWEADSTHVRTSINTVATANNPKKHIAMANLSQSCYYEITLEEHNANARLIAASPELFRILDDLVYQVERCCYNCNQWLDYSEAREILNKIESGLNNDC